MSEKEVPLNIENAKYILLDRYDVDELVDILGIDAKDLLDRFEDYVEGYIKDYGRELSEEDDDET